MRNLNLDPKYLLKRWGPPILLLLFFLAFVICTAGIPGGADL